MKNILVINAHPILESFCDGIAEKYIEGAKKAGYKVKTTNVRELDLSLNPIDSTPVNKRKIKAEQTKLEWSHHIVIVTPMWWLNFPALMRAYIEQVMTQDFAYKHKNGRSPIPQRLLQGRSLRLINTQDSNRFFTDFVLMNCFSMGLRFGIFWYVGIWPVHRSVMSKVRWATVEKREQWLESIYKLGYHGK